jgi:hypothetical protein
MGSGPERFYQPRYGERKEANCTERMASTSNDFFAVFVEIDEVIRCAKLFQVLRIKRVLSSRRIRMGPAFHPVLDPGRNSSADL